MSFAMDFVTKLDGKLSTEELEIVCRELEVFCTQFDISQKETRIANIEYFPDFYKIFFVSKKIKGCSQGTLEQYKLQLDYFFEFVRKPVKEIKREDVMGFLYHLQVVGKPGRSPMSDGVTDGIRRILNSFFSWAVVNDYLDCNPVAGIDKIKAEKKRRKPLTDIELEKLRFTLDNANRNKIGKYRQLDIRNLALFEVMYSTGARISEITTLDRNHVNLETMEVELYGKGKKHRISYLNAKAVFYLKMYLNLRDDNNPALFVSYKKPHERISNSAIRAVLKRGGERAKLDGHIFPHRIRHTTATNALKHGMPLEEIQKLLGHEKPETTLIYADLLQENVKADHQRYII